MNVWYLSLGAGALAATPFMLLGLHRLLLRLEEAGYIYYLHKKPQSGALSSLCVLHEMVEPGHRHVAEAREQVNAETSQRQWVIAQLLSLLQADQIDREVIAEVLRTCGTDARANYAEAVRLAVQANPRRPRAFPAAEDILPN